MRNVVGARATIIMGEVIVGEGAHIGCVLSTEPASCMLHPVQGALRYVIPEGPCG